MFGSLIFHFRVCVMIIRGRRGLLMQERARVLWILHRYKDRGRRSDLVYVSMHLIVREEEAMAAGRFLSPSSRFLPGKNLLAHLFMI